MLCSSASSSCCCRRTCPVAAAARDARAARAARPSSPQLDFAARPVNASLNAVVRHGLPVAVHCSRACDVTVNAWLRHAFYGEAAPPETPMVFRWTAGEWMIFAVPARPGATPIWRMDLNYATQIDTTPTPACDFTTIPMFPVGNAYLGAVRIGAPQACGPPPAPDNVIYYASVKDLAGFTISSRVYRGDREMTFSPDFAPVLQHFPRDNFPVPPPPDRCLVPPPG